MKKFSQRKGFTPVSDIIQIDTMTDALRNCLWNVLDTVIWSIPGFVSDLYEYSGKINQFSLILWARYFKRPIDSRPESDREILKSIRSYFFSCEWYQVYDLLEFIVSECGQYIPRDLSEYFNEVLESELAGYRFVNGYVTDITTREEARTIEEATTEPELAGVSAHINRALSLYADRSNPDFRNSIKESISAVEAIARVVSGRDKATLSDALKSIEKDGRLHTSLKGGFLKLYGYTSDEQGIRHAMLYEPNLTAADARYFLISCSAFVNYLKAQI